jgi:glyoxylase-like metal-dependent hydrolase (beta-lactamase superfamily II)
VAHVGDLRVLLAGDTLWGGFSAAIGSDEEAWRHSLERLAALELDALSFGHGISRLLDDPAGRIAEARQRFASYFDPWFKPPKQLFRY